MSGSRAPVRRAASTRRRARLLSGAFAAAAALAACGSGGPTVEVRDVYFEALRAPDSMLLTYGTRSDRPGARGFSPVRGSDASPRASLMLPPGAVLELKLPDDLPADCELELDFAAVLDGVDEAAVQARSMELRIEGGFGARVFEAPVPGPEAGRELRQWTPARLGVEPGDALRLSVEFDGSAPRVLAALAGVIASHTRSVPRQTASTQQPNLVFVVIDTLRADRTSLERDDRDTTPYLAALAERGTTFRRAFSTSPWTWPSTASMLTGQLPAAHGVLDRFSCYLAEELTSLAERAQAAGLVTAGYSTNPLISRAAGFAQGFAEFATSSWERDSVPVDYADEFLERVGDDRFFLYLHLTDPHSPYEPGPDERARFVGEAPEGYTLEGFRTRLKQAWRNPAARDAEYDSWLAHTSDLYDGEVASADRALGDLVALLDERGLADNTVLVVTSDHGEELMDHGRLGHAEQLFIESVHVPLVIVGPGVAAGRETALGVQNHHLAGTLCELLGLPGPHADEYRDLLDLAANADAAEHELWLATDTGFWRGEPQMRRLESVRVGSEFLVFSRKTDELPSRMALFDTALDPLELENVAGGAPERAQSLRTEAAELWDRLGATRPTAIDGGDAVGEMLERLGYKAE